MRALAVLLWALVGCSSVAPGGAAAPTGSAPPTDAAAPTGEPVPLLTGWGLGSAEKGAGCHTLSVRGVLVADPTSGTAIKVDSGSPFVGKTMPVMWLPDFTGRRVGSEVVVLDPEGKVVATTGLRYQIAGIGGEDQTGRGAAFAGCDILPLQAGLRPPPRVFSDAA